MTNTLFDKANLYFDYFPINYFPEISFNFEISNVVIQLNYSGRNANKVLNFIKTYFQKFKRSFMSPDIVINYYNPEGLYGDSDWIFWNEWSHEIDCRKEKNGYIIVQRDFVGFWDGGMVMNCIGPEWSYASIDSLDNIISYLLPKSLLKKDGLVLHSASVVIDDYAYVFFGKSGAGKSTLATFAEKMGGAKIISSDQSILYYDHNVLYSSLMPTTIPEFPLNHPSRCHEAKPVKGLIYLYQGKENYLFKKLSKVDWIKYFMKEIIYRKEFLSEKLLLSLSLKILDEDSILRGSMCYSLETNFLKYLLSEEI